jgi:hypothetical protein
LDVWTQAGLARLARCGSASTFVGAAVITVVIANIARAPLVANAALALVPTNASIRAPPCLDPLRFFLHLAVFTDLVRNRTTVDRLPEYCQLIKQIRNYCLKLIREGRLH